MIILLLYPCVVDITHLRIINHAHLHTNFIT